MNENGRFRKRSGYTTTGNTLTRDPSVSLKAKGLYLVIMSYITLPNFDLTKNFVFKQCKEGEKSFESSWNELKDSGYLKVYFIQGKNGFQAEYELLDEPVNGPHTFYLDMAGNIKSTNEDRKKKKEGQASPSAEPIQECTANSKDPILSIDRYPQKGGNGNEPKRYPPYGSNANGGNNINTINKPDSLLNNLSVNYCAEKEDGQTDDEKKAIPYELANHPKAMLQTIKELSACDEYCQDPENQPIEQQSFSLAVECLSEMATQLEPKLYGSSLVTYKNVIDKINQCCQKGDFYPLRFFLEITIEDYIQALTSTSIKNLKAYLKSCIWNSFATYELKWQSFFERSYRAGP